MWKPFAIASGLRAIVGRMFLSATPPMLYDDVMVTEVGHFLCGQEHHLAVQYERCLEDEDGYSRGSAISDDLRRN